MDTEILENIRETLGERAANYFQMRDSQMDSVNDEITSLHQQIDTLQAVVSLLRENIGRENSYSDISRKVNDISVEVRVLASRLDNVSNGLQKLNDEL